jgi:hypothetical protein
MLTAVGSLCVLYNIVKLQQLALFLERPQGMLVQFFLAAWKKVHTLLHQHPICKLLYKMSE